MKPMIPKRTRRLRARAATMNTHEAEFEDYGPEPNMKLSHAFLVVLMLHVIAVGGLYAFNSLKANKPGKTQLAKATAPVDPAPEPSGNREPSSEGPGNQPPKEKSPALVAKPSEGAKVSKTTDAAAPKVPATAPKSLLQKAAALAAGVTAGSTAKIRAQDAVAPVPSPAAEAPVAAPAAVIAPTASYTVVAGDSMTRIASKLGVAIPELEKVNGLTGSSVLQVGQVLKVPDKVMPTAGEGTATQAAAVSVPTTPAATNAAGGGMTEYTVVKGDNPYKIAKRFKVGFEELMKVNNITDPKKIQIGQKLMIPASTKKGAK